jgi:Flp pilus assembly protein protease CpaA
MPVLGMALLILLGCAVIGIPLVIAIFAETRRNNQANAQFVRRKPGPRSAP